MTNGEGSFSRGKFVEELDKTFGAGKYSLSTDGSILTINEKEYETGLPGKWRKAEKTAMTDNNITEVTGDDIENNNLKDETKIKAVIKDEDNAQIPIPVDAEYLEGKENTGVVIKYKGSEFVWVPVPVTANDDLYVKGTTKPMARRTTINGSETDSKGKKNYQGALYDFSGTGENTTSTENTTYVQGTTNYREPDVLTNSTHGDWSTKSSRGYELIKQCITGMSEKSNAEIQTQWKNQLQEEYNAMVESIAKYGGFFVGRYETSYNGSKVASVAGVKPMTAETTSGGTWYGMYQKQKDFTTTSDKMTANMIWGSQYDAMLNWALEGANKTHVSASDNALHDYSDSIDLLTRTTTENDTTTELDRINNIYDLEGNLYEWTQSVNGTYNRFNRGGSYDSNNSPSFKGVDLPYDTDDRVGSRLSLYINV